MGLHVSNCELFGGRSCYKESSLVGHYTVVDLNITVSVYPGLNLL